MLEGVTHIYVESDSYTADFLEYEYMPDAHGGYYLGRVYSG